MKWIYILIMLMIAAFTLGCVDKNPAETTAGTYGVRGNTDFSSGVDRNQAETPSEMPLTPEPGEDLGTYSDLAEMDNISSDLDMQITLSTEI